MNRLQLILPALLLAVVGGCSSADYTAAQPLPAGQLAFVANRSGNWELFLLGPGQTSPAQLTNTPLDERAPAISPDGSQIAYATSDGALWVMSVSSRATQQVGSPPNQHGHPTWNRDGTGLVYTVYSFTPPTEDADFFFYSLKEKQQRLFLQQTGPQDFPALSANGDRLAYMSSLATLIPGFGGTVVQQLWVASLQDGRSQQLFWSSSRDTKPAWSPDSRRLAFSSDRNGNPDIWIADADGREPPSQVSDGPGAKTAPAWSPDGSEIVYVLNASGRSDLVVLNVRTKQSRTLLMGSKPQEIRDPAWR